LIFVHRSCLTPRPQRGGGEAIHLNSEARNPGKNHGFMVSELNPNSGLLSILSIVALHLLAVKNGK
jgi:hypothetical protein